MEWQLLAYLAMGTTHCGSESTCINIQLLAEMEVAGSMADCRELTGLNQMDVIIDMWDVSPLNPHEPPTVLEEFRA